MGKWISFSLNVKDDGTLRGDLDHFWQMRTLCNERWRSPSSCLAVRREAPLGSEAYLQTMAHGPEEGPSANGEPPPSAGLGALGRGAAGWAAARADRAGNRWAVAWRGVGYGAVAVDAGPWRQLVERQNPPFVKSKRVGLARSIGLFIHTSVLCFRATWGL